MKKYVALFGLSLLAGIANAQWVKFADSNNAETPTYYINKSLTQYSGSKVKLWELQDYSAPVVVGRASFLSAKVLTEYDCANNTATILSGSALKGFFNQGASLGVSVFKQAWWCPAKEFKSMAPVLA